jgi:hypothetical protein
MPLGSKGGGIRATKVSMAQKIIGMYVIEAYLHAHASDWSKKYGVVKETMTFGLLEPKIIRKT